MNRLLLIISLLSLFLFMPLTASARSGCCSHHNGVRADGCGCNDGTPLSSTCAPYYSCTSFNEVKTDEVNKAAETNVLPKIITKAPIKIPTKYQSKSFTTTPMSTPTITPSTTPVLSKVEIKKSNVKINPTPTPKISLIEKIIRFFKF